MRFSFRRQLVRIRQSLKFHYVWRSFFFDQTYAGIVKISEKAHRLSARIIVAYGIATAALILTNAVTRIVAARALPWAEELCSWLLIGICFIGSGIALKTGLHVGITIIIEAAPSWSKKTLVFMGNLFCTVFLLCLIGISFITACRISGNGTFFAIPLAVPYMQIPLSGILLLLQILPFLAGPLLKDSIPEKFLLTRIVPEE